MQQLKLSVVGGVVDQGRAAFGAAHAPLAGGLIDLEQQFALITGLVWHQTAL
jgi:hypothetical protein